MVDAPKKIDIDTKARENKAYGNLLRECMSMGRKLFYSYRVTLKETSSSDTDPLDAGSDVSVVATKQDRVNLIGSEIYPGVHAPVFDVDFPVRAIPSRTPGHYHLYIDKAVSWEDYKELLNVLAKIGIVEKGYASASIAKGGTFVRLPELEHYGK